MFDWFGGRRLGGHCDRSFRIGPSSTTSFHPSASRRRRFVTNELVDSSRFAVGLTSSNRVLCLLPADQWPAAFCGSLFVLFFSFSSSSSSSSFCCCCCCCLFVSCFFFFFWFSLAPAAIFIAHSKTLLYVYDVSIDFYIYIDHLFNWMLLLF